MQRGFTLVELAIVLVIIGLIVGGVLVGQDLIKAAEIRAVASDIQKYNTSVAAFQVKYAGIPGDLLSTAATNFGLTVSATSPGTQGEGDGNGYLQNGASASGGCYNGLGGETTLFWRQLTDAKMIPFGSTADGTTIDTTNFGTGSTTQTTLAPLIPGLRIRPTGFIHISGRLGITYYTISSFNRTGGVNGTCGGLASTAVLSPREAQGIDQKLDDGFPATGIVMSFPLNTFVGIAAPGNGSSPVTAADTLCYDNTTAQGAYATSSEDIANGIRCALRIKAGF